MKERVNCAIFYGTSFDRDAWKFKVINSFPEYWKVFMVNRFEKIDFKPNDNVNVLYVYNHEIFQRNLSKKELTEAENYVGLSFIHILRSWYNWDKKIEKDEKELEKRFEAVAKYVLFWRDFFLKNKIDVFVGVLESTYVEITSQEVAKKLNIPIINIGDGGLGNSFMIYDENFLPIYWKHLENGEKDRVWQGFKDMYSKKKDVENIAHLKYIESYRKLSFKHLHEKISKIFCYWMNYRNANVLDKYRTNPPSQLLINYIKHLVRRRYAKLKFKSIDYSKINFFFFPLHYVDEASLSYQEPFTNQFMLIEYLARCLPLDAKLIVKPHPHYQCMDIPLKEIKKISELRNVVLVNPNLSPYDLIPKSKAVIVINSTTGFESLIFERPVITFGHRFYALDGVTRVVRDYLELPRIIMDAYNGKLVKDKEKIKEVVALYYKNIIPFEGTYISGHYNLTDKDGRNIVNGILTAYNMKTNNLKND